MYLQERANYLGIYVAPRPLSLDDGLLQVGGEYDLGPAEHHDWANGNSSAPGTTVIDTVALNTPLTFGGGESNPGVWLGNITPVRSTYGIWTGSITFGGIANTAPVPELSSFALMAFGGLGLAGWVGRGRKKAEATVPA